METYINSIGKGHNIIKAIYDDKINRIDTYRKQTIHIDKDGSEKVIFTFDYDGIYNSINELRTLIYDVHENDAEIYFKFKVSDCSIIEPYLEFSTYGAKISPFSVKNLPKNNYEIPYNDKQKLIELTKDLGALASGQFSRQFLSSICSKKYTKDDLKSDMRKSCLYGNAYIHYAGLWDRYLNYVSKKLNQ